MALEDNFEERTEEATDERRREFRERGEVAQSREFTSVFALLGTLIFFALYGVVFFDQMKNLMVRVFSHYIRSGMTIGDISQFLLTVTSSVAKFMSPLFLAVISLVLLSGLSQTKLNFSWHRLKPNFQKLNPLTGMKRFFSAQILMELFKSVAKILTVGLVAYSVLFSEIFIIPQLARFSVESLWIYWGEVVGNIFIRVLAILLIISGIDYFYNWITLQRKMRMTKQMVKEELKNREGDPIIRRRIREVQRQLSRRRMIENMKKATVLITNPTHYAVALQYEQGMAAPLVVAKGQDFLAMKLKEVAKKMDIPVIENKPLARTLYKMLKIGQEIPESLYKAVSEIIAYVFKLKRKS